MVSGSPRSANSSSLGLTMVCSIITPSAGSACVGHLEEVVVAVAAEVLERADRHDPVDRLVELLPALQQHPLAARAVGLLGEQPARRGPAGSGSASGRRR